jgi:hypothetical protein
MFNKIKCSKCKKPIVRKVVETETVETEYHEYDRQKIELYIYTDYNTDEINESAIFCKFSRHVFAR